MTKDPSPLKINCFHCQKPINIKYVRACGGYSRKNNWEYWTKNEENKDKYICDDCLVTLYYQHKWEFHHLIPNKEKQTLLRQYITDDDIKGKIRKFFEEDRCPRCSKKKKKRLIIERKTPYHQIQNEGKTIISKSTKELAILGYL